MLIVASVNAQRIDAQHDFNSMLRPATPAEVAESNDLGRALMEQWNAVDRGGDVFFYEDFSEGFDGSTPFGAWTFEDSGGNSIWMEADANSPAGEFSTNIGALESTTADNGWMIFDCDLYNTPIADGVEDVTGRLISPVLDMSGLNSVIVEWEQYFRYCCFSPAPVFIEVTTDGGDNWTAFPAWGDFIQSANTTSANPLPTGVDISCAAAGESNVQIAFSYLQNPAVGNGYSHYYWGVDDVTIRENTVVDDLRIAQVTTGDVFNYFEYRSLPIEQAIPEDEGGLVAGVMYRNAGNVDQTNVVVTVDILDDGGNVLTSVSSEPFTAPAAANAELCPQNTNDTLYIETNWAPEAIGDYTVVATIESDATDETPDNNTRERPITYTTDIYAHDDEEEWNVEFRPRDGDNGLFNPTGYGNFYTANNPGTTAYGALVAFGPNTGTDFLEFELRFYTIEPGVFLNDAGFEVAFYTVAPEYVPGSIAGAELIYYPFEDPIQMNVANPTDLDEDYFYFVGVLNDFESEEELTVVGNGNSDTDNSTGAYEQTGAGDFVWFTAQTATPAIRLVTSEQTSVDELAQRNGVQLMQNMPNPAAESTTIEFFLLSSKEVLFELYDAQGRLVDQNDMGTLQGGEHRIVYPVSELQSGVYYYNLVVDGVRLTKKMIVQRY